ncbi:hypothetical protein Tsp_07960 [Trichinella spiralis]|nr:hypothetical protein Tsp_07960 [Trichinella spiralis]
MLAISMNLTHGSTAKIITFKVGLFLLQNKNMTLSCI